MPLLLNKTLNFSITSTKIEFYYYALTIDSLDAVTFIVFDLNIFGFEKERPFYSIWGGVTMYSLT